MQLPNLLSSPIMAQAEIAVQRKSFLLWMFESLGIYGLLLPVAGLAVFLGACLVVALSQRPAVIASYLVFLPLPALIGIYGSVHGAISVLSVIAMSATAADPAVIAEGVSTALFTTFVGLTLTIPSYFVLAIGLLLRAVQSGKTPAK